jgi:hypothetical protein
LINPRPGAIIPGQKGAAAEVPEGDGDAGSMRGAIHEFRWMAAVSASLFVLDTLLLRR